MNLGHVVDFTQGVEDIYEVGNDAVLRPGVGELLFEQLMVKGLGNPALNA